MDEALQDIRQAILTELEKETNKEKQKPDRDELRKHILDAIHRRGLTLDFHVRDAFIEELIQDAIGYGPIESFMQNPDITEIWIYGFDKIVVEQAGKRFKTKARFRDDEHLRNTLEKILAPVGKRLDESEPRVDVRLSDGSRLNAVIVPIAVDGTQVTIRKFKKGLSLRDLIETDSLSTDAASFLSKAVTGRANIMVSGGTSSGKTTLLNGLSEYWGDMESVVVIEDPAELNLKGKWVRRMEARGRNVQGEGEVTVQELVKNSLRQNPDRIIVGEVRDGTAVDMLQAMITGHAGSMSTIHADSVEGMCNDRLPDLISEGNPMLPPAVILKRIASALDIGVHVEQMEGKRRVIQIAEISEGDDAQVAVRDLFRLRKGHLKQVAEPSSGFQQKLAHFGVDVTQIDQPTRNETGTVAWDWSGGAVS